MPISRIAVSALLLMSFFAAACSTSEAPAASQIDGHEIASPSETTSAVQTTVTPTTVPPTTVPTSTVPPTTVPPTTVATPTVAPATIVRPIGTIMVSPHTPTNLPIAFSPATIGPIAAVLSNHGEAELLERARTVDFSTTMLVGRTVTGCTLNSVEIEPTTIALLLHVEWDDSIDCFVPNYFFSVFAVPLSGRANDGDFLYSPNAVPSVFASDRVGVDTALVDLSDELRDRALPAGAMRSDASFLVSDHPMRSVASLALTETELARLPEDELYSIQTSIVLTDVDVKVLRDQLSGSDLDLISSHLWTLDLNTEYAALVFINACSPAEFWLEFVGDGIVVTAYESGGVCDEENSYGTFFILPRVSLVDGQSPTVTTQNLRPSPAD